MVVQRIDIFEHMIESKVIKQYDLSKVNLFKYEPLLKVSAAPERIIYPDFSKELEDKEKERLNKSGIGASSSQEDFVAHHEFLPNHPNLASQGFIETPVKEESEKKIEKCAEFGDRSKTKDDIPDIKEFDRIEDKLKVESQKAGEALDEIHNAVQHTNSATLTEKKEMEEVGDLGLKENIIERNDRKRGDTVKLKRHLEILEAERNKYRKIGYKEGYDNGLNEAKDKFLREYEIKKADYLELLASSYADSLAEIRKIRDILLDMDKDIPKIVINFVRRIIGFERKINDKIIISVVKAKLEKLKVLEGIKFYVHPDDIDYIKSEFPGYDVAQDPTVIKGGFRVSSNIGEVNFDINKMLDNLEELINEELKVAEST
jgi:flagellar assembly protein FliH